MKKTEKENEKQSCDYRQEVIEASQLVQDEKNINKGTDKGRSLLCKSLDELGAGRSILIDRNNNIIAGNKTAEQYGLQGGKKVVVVETDGETLVAVRRTDIDIDSKKGRELAVADNMTQKFNFNLDRYQAMELSEFGLNLDDWHINIKDTEKLSFSGKLNKNLYMQKGKRPDRFSLAECIDLSLYSAKKKIVDDSGLSDCEKTLFTFFCYRFIKIDFQRVAKYYIWFASPEEKRLIERLRMVLIDNGVGGFVEDGLLAQIDFLDKYIKGNEYTKKK